MRVIQLSQWFKAAKPNEEGSAADEAMVISEVREGQIAKVWYAPTAGNPPSH